MVENRFNVSLNYDDHEPASEMSRQLKWRKEQAKNTIDSRRPPPLLFAPMKKALILVVGRRMGKAV